MIVAKTPEQLDKMAAAGSILVRCLRVLRSKARPGVTLLELDEAAERFIDSQGARAAFKGYRGFPGSICASPNSMVVHGIPGPYELKPKDILSIDVGVVHDGWVADAAFTVPIGDVNGDTRKLLDTTREALFAGVEQVRPGNHLGDVSAAIQERVEREGLSIIRSLVGHGIGREMHEDPQVPNYGEPGRGPLLEPGMTFAIEPMVNAGGPDVRLGEDSWAVYSKDGSLAAHYEFTVAVTEDGPRVLTPGTRTENLTASDRNYPGGKVSEGGSPPPRFGPSWEPGCVSPQRFDSIRGARHRLGMGSGLTGRSRRAWIVTGKGLNARPALL